MNGAGREEVTAFFAAGVASICAARHQATEQLQAWGLDEQLPTAALVVSELATNAVLHANSEFSLTLAKEDDSLCIAVGDESEAPPRLGTLPPDARAGGFGLKIVNDLSSAWGWEPRPHGKTVWAALNTAL